MSLFDKVFNKGNKKSPDPEYPFADAKNMATITCRHVMKDDKPILYVSHDADDGMWQFLCGDTHENEDAMLVSLHEVYLHDTTISSIATMPLGRIAERKDIYSAWKVRRR